MDTYLRTRPIGILLLLNAAVFIQSPIYTTLKARSTDAGADIGAAVIIAMALVGLNLIGGLYLLKDRSR